TSVKFSFPSSKELNLSIGEEESEEAFRRRCQELAWQDFGKALEAETQTYASGFSVFKVAVPSAPAVGPSSPWAERLAAFVTGIAAVRAQGSDALPADKQRLLADQERDWQRELTTLAERFRRRGEQFQALSLSPKKSDVQVTRFGLAWVPFWQSGAATSAAY